MQGSRGSVHPPAPACRWSQLCPQGAGAWHLWAGRGGEPGGPRRVPGTRGEGQGRGAWGGPGAGDRPVVCRDAGRGVRPAASEDVRKGVRQTASDARTPQRTFSRCPVCKTTRARAEAEMPPSRPATPTLRGRAPREGPRPNVAKSVLAPQRARRGAWTELLGGPRPRRPAGALLSEQLTRVRLQAGLTLALLLCDGARSPPPHSSILCPGPLGRA